MRFKRAKSLKKNKAKTSSLRILPFPKALPSPGTRYSSFELQNRAKAKVYQLVALSRDGSIKPTYGAAFVVDENGLLATSFHLVSDSLQTPSSSYLELLINERERIPAKVINFDVMNDLALIKVQKRFRYKYNLSANSLRQSQKIFSLTLDHNATIGLEEGAFRAEKRNEFARRLYTLLPLNSGVSGAPVVNESDQVVGIRDIYRTRAQKDSILIPAAELKNLISSVSRSPASSSDPSKRIQGQIQAHLASWLREWKENKRYIKSKSLSPYYIRELPRNLKCQGKGNQEWSQYNCGGMMGALFGSGKSGVEISFQYETRNTDYFNFLGDEYVPEIFLEKGASLKEQRRDYLCHDRLLENAHGVKLHAQFCASQVERNPVLVNLQMSVRSLESGEVPLSGYMKAVGLPRKLIREASEMFVNGISLRSRASKDSGASP